MRALQWLLTAGDHRRLKHPTGALEDFAQVLAVSEFTKD